MHKQKKKKKDLEKENGNKVGRKRKCYTEFKCILQSNSCAIS